MTLQANPLALENISTSSSLSGDEVLQQCKQAVQECLQAKEYGAAEKLIIACIQQLGPSVANKLYPLIWEQAMADGRGRLRSYFLKEQSSWDWENVQGESLRQSMLSMAIEPPPVSDRPLSETGLMRMSQSPVLQPHWPLWEESIRILHDYLLRVPAKSEAAATRVQHEPMKPVILTAGSGRSGSSAAFDWINGFHDIKGTRSQYFYLRDFMFTLKTGYDSTEYRQHLVDLLWRTFMGRYVYTGKSAYRKAVLARSIILTLGADKAGLICRDVMKILVSPDAECDHCLVKLPLLLACIKHMLAPEAERFAATGWLDFDAAEAYPHLTNAQIVCVTRDPRDIYAEHLVLTRTFDKKVNNFIADYREKMKSLESVLAEKPANVFVVRFEDFVSSDALRDELAHSLNIDVSKGRRTGGRFPFVAERSAKNVGVHTKCEDKAALKKIEEALPQYCHL